MKKSIGFVVLCSLLAILACAPKPTADSVVKNVVEKLGGDEKLASIEDQVSEWEFVMHVMPPGMPGSEMEMMEQMESEAMEDMPEHEMMRQEMAEGEMADEEMTEENEMMQHEMAEETDMMEQEMAESESMEEQMADTEMMGEGYAMPMRITYKRPNKLRMDMMDDSGNIVYYSVYNGTAGWINEMGEQKPMTEAERQEYATMAKTWVDFLADHEEKGISVELLEDESIGGQTYHVLQATDEFDNVSKYYVNTETHLVERQAGEMVNYVGEKEPMYMTLGDYQMRDGILVAHDVAQYQEDGTLIWESKLQDISNNVGVTDDLFVSQEMTMKQ